MNQMVSETFPASDVFLVVAPQHLCSSVIRKVEIKIALDCCDAPVDVGVAYACGQRAAKLRNSTSSGNSIERIFAGRFKGASFR